MYKKSRIASRLIWFSLLVMLFTKGCSCWEKLDVPEKPKESATSGDLVVMTDNGLKPIVEKQASEFVRRYPQSHIKVEENSTNGAVEKLLNNEVRAIVIGRKFNRSEDSVITKFKLEFKRDLIGRDAACVVINRENPVQTLTLAQLKDILTGKITDWSQVGGSAQPIRLFVTGQNDGQRAFLQDSLKISGFAEKAYPCTSAVQMKEYVQKFKGGIGYTSLSGVRDLTDPTKRDTVKQIKLLSLASDKPESKSYLPYQENVFKGLYPLTYGIYCYYSDYERLPKGLAAFLGREGQKVFLRNGVGPVEIPITVIHFKEDE
ncbi:MAG: hypothetical protein HGB11_11655 [Chlorobiales bacterium]|nr:hypothetical protein [Chlorobiales bacterium]